MSTINRRNFLKYAGAGAISLSLAGSPLGKPSLGAAMNGSKRPNIIFVHTDSWDGRALGFMGRQAMRNATPNIDKLAKRGTAFRNTYCSHPICCPSRSNMWSGTYTFRCKSWNNYKGLDDNVKTLFDEFRQAGYKLASDGPDKGGIGKHDYRSGGHSNLARLTAWTSTADVQLPFFRIRAPQIIQEPHTARRDWKKVQMGLDFLEKNARANQPFFLYVGLSYPHPPFTTSPQWAAMVDQDKVTIPPLDKQLHPVMKYQRITKNWQYGFDDEPVRRIRSIYYSMCAETDAMVGQLIDKMDELGLTENTYFVFSSDHGENNMEHRQWYKMNMYESSVRVPLVIAGPGVKSGQYVDDIVSLIDIFPTFTELADLPTTGGLDGQSLMPLLKGRSHPSRNWAFACFTGCTANTSIFMLRKGDWKYIAYPGFEPQLFNLKTDPDEIDNVAPHHPDIVRQMDQALMEVCDYPSVHVERVAYDKQSFLKYRSDHQKNPIHLKEYGADIPQAYYMDIMKNTYIGYSPENEQHIDKWLST